MEALTKCFSCGAETEKVNGPTHKYLLSTPGCWARYGEVLAREYSDFRYMAVHDLTVDAYSIQHPGQPNPQTINSLNIHLASLYAFFELGLRSSELSEFKQKLAKQKPRFRWMETPLKVGQYNINDVWGTDTPEAHQEMVKRWAEDAFRQWHAYSANIAAIAKIAC